MVSAYKDVSGVVDILNTLSFSGTYQVVVAADCISLKDRNRLEDMGAVVDWSAKRRGKANALNSAFRQAKGELLIFLDSDTLPVTEGFMDKIWDSYLKHGFDVATGKVKVRHEKFLQKMVNIEYLFISAFFSVARAFNEVPPLLGAFFVMKHKCFDHLGGFSRVVVEDCDLGFRASAEGYTFKFLKDITVETAAPSRPGEWMTQRKRWASGFISSIFSHKKKVVKNVPFTFTSMLTYYPLPITSLIWTIFLFFFASQITVFGVMFAALLSSSGILFIFNRLLNWEAGFRASLFYILVYGPLWSLFSLWMLFTAPFGNRKLKDWMV